MIIIGLRSTSSVSVYVVDYMYTYTPTPEFRCNTHITVCFCSQKEWVFSLSGNVRECVRGSCPFLTTWCASQGAWNVILNIGSFDFTIPKEEFDSKLWAGCKIHTTTLTLHQLKKLHKTVKIISLTQYAKNISPGRCPGGILTRCPTTLTGSSQCRGAVDRLRSPCSFFWVCPTEIHGHRSLGTCLWTFPQAWMGAGSR